ncbi:MAG: caspase family protein [Deltaproteobacteria bacterium]|nr:caspase family protein [Deltaproteobacteria bacterium]
MHAGLPVAVVALAVALALSPATAARAAAARTEARALVIAVNASGGPGLAPLRFADDDGLRWAETLTRLGVETSLLTVMDEETARVSPLPQGTLPATLEGVRRAVARLRAANEETRKAGAVAETWVVYIGHGVLDESGRASLTLIDGRLDQKSLYAEVVDALRADYVHLVVDACHAAGVVGRRGASKDPLVARIREKLAAEALKSRPSVGALFAESEDGETHEWTRLRAGVFSFLARSALLGAADVNGDGAVEYSELDAYLGAALQRVNSYPVRLAVHSFAPPADRRRPLARLGERAPRLSAKGEQEGEPIIVEDELGVPLAGFHRAAPELVGLLLPERPLYWLRTSKQEAKVAMADVGHARFDWKPRTLQSRGPAADELERGLLNVPFGRAFYEGFVSRSSHVPVTFVDVREPAAASTPNETRWRIEVGAGVGSAALGLSGVGMGADAAVHRLFGPASVGARVGYGVSPKAGPAELTVHRGTLEAVVGVEGRYKIRPFAELGLGWLAVAFSRDGRSVGDPLGLTTHLAVGAGIPAGPVEVRMAARLAMDLAEVDGERKPFLAPGGEIGLMF